MDENPLRPKSSEEERSNPRSPPQIAALTSLNITLLCSELYWRTSNVNWAKLMALVSCCSSQRFSDAAVYKIASQCFYFSCGAHASCTAFVSQNKYLSAKKKKKSCRSERRPLKSAPGSVWSQLLSIIWFKALVQHEGENGCLHPAQHNKTSTWNHTFLWI